MSIFLELDDLLDQERKLILAGAFDKLSRISEYKSQLMERLSIAHPKSSKYVSQCRRKSLENGELLEAAAKGVKAAMGQVRDALHTADQSTYSENGAKLSLFSRSSKLEKKF